MHYKHFEQTVITIVLFFNCFMYKNPIQPDQLDKILSAFHHIDRKKKPAYVYSLIGQHIAVFINMECNLIV